MNEVKGECDTCSKPCVKSCSNCKKVFYCSVNCQKKSRSTHRPHCFPAHEIESLKDSYLVATRDIEEGEAIFQELPLFVGPAYHSGGTTCLGCCKVLADRQTSKCPQCNWPLCSPSCDKITEHSRNECTIFKTHCVIFQDQETEYEIVKYIRLLLLRLTNPKKWEQFMSLPFKVMDDLDSITRKRSLIHIIRQLSSLKNFEEITILKVMDIEVSNRIGLLDTQDKSCLLIYNNAQKIRHDCVPNTKNYNLSKDKKGKFGKASEALGIMIVATIKIKKGEALKKSSYYGNVMDGTLPRRKRLKLDGIECKCERCLDPTELGTYLSAIKCASIPCEGYNLPLNPLDTNSNWKCGKCSQTLESNSVESLIEKINQEVSTINALVEKCGFDNFFVMREFLPADFECMSKMEKFLEKWDTQLHPNHYQLFKVKKMFAAAHHALMILPRPSTYSVEVRDQRLKLLEKYQDLVEYCLPIANVILPGLSLFRGKILYLLGSCEYLKCQEYLYCGGEVHVITELYKEAIESTEMVRKIFANMPGPSYEELMVSLLDGRKEAVAQMASLNPVMAKEFDRLEF